MVRPIGPQHEIPVNPPQFQFHPSGHFQVAGQHSQAYFGLPGQQRQQLFYPAVQALALGSFQAAPENRRIDSAELIQIAFAALEAVEHG